MGKGTDIINETLDIGASALSQNAKMLAAAKGVLDDTETVTELVTELCRIEPLMAENLLSGLSASAVETGNKIHGGDNGESMQHVLDLVAALCTNTDENIQKIGRDIVRDDDLFNAEAGQSVAKTLKKADLKAKRGETTAAIRKALGENLIVFSE